MKRILIDEGIKQLAEEYKSQLDGDQNAPKPISNLEALKGGLKRLGEKYKEYIDVVKDCYIHHQLITLKPSEFERIHNDYFVKFQDGRSKIDLSKCFSKRKPDGKWGAKEPFYMHIVKALRYKDVQSDIYPTFLLKMGIRACVYCNAAFSVGSKEDDTDGDKDNKINYTLDHYKPKNKYPYLAVSFFNLYPCCASCNSTKAQREPIWQLYAEAPREDLNPFIFELEKASRLKYELSWNADDLQILFHDKRYASAFSDIYSKYFHIRKLYNCFKPEVEEILWKQKIYNSTMINLMRSTLPHNINIPDTRRLILGNYCDEKDILKRPLAKLYQDIAKQIHLL